MKKERLTKFKLTASSKLSAAGRAELRAMEKAPIDTSDIPEVTEFKRSEWRRGLFQMPQQKRKQAMEEMRRQQAVRRARKQVAEKGATVRIDADVVDWFKNHAPKGDGYQAGINMALRKHVERHSRRA